MTSPRAQRRNRRVAMTPAEVNEFLASERTCRVATQNPRGPHLSALWYVWDTESLWLYSIVRSQRWADITTDPRVAVLVDAGEHYGELRGVELLGRAEIVGEVPRSGKWEERLDAVERHFARKYFDAESMVHDQRHGWLRIQPTKITSWDFRKLQA